jgi:hypothetical protein
MWWRKSQLKLFKCQAVNEIKNLMARHELSWTEAVEYMKYSEDSDDEGVENYSSF